MTILMNKLINIMKGDIIMSNFKLEYFFRRRLYIKENSMVGELVYIQKRLIRERSINAITEENLNTETVVADRRTIELTSLPNQLIKKLQSEFELHEEYPLTYQQANNILNHYSDNLFSINKNFITHN